MTLLQYLDRIGKKKSFIMMNNNQTKFFFLQRDKLEKYPPTKLQQDYYECTLTV